MPTDRLSPWRTRALTWVLALGIGTLAGSLAALSPARAQSDPAQPLASADSDDSSLAKKLQNPIGDLISVPFQNNLNLGAGPNKSPQNILNIQPVVPFHLNANWNLITRTILPVVWNGWATPGHSRFGLGATDVSAFLSPREPKNGWLWGAGPIVQIPTATDTSLGSNIWGLGPTVVIVKTTKSIVGGVLVNDVMSLGGTSGALGTRYNLLTINPFLNYNFQGGWFLGTVPIITASLDSPGAKWTLPIGLQGGRLIKFGKLPVNLLAGAYYNALRPSYGGTWQFRAQIAFIF